MAYSTANEPWVVAQFSLLDGRKMWLYRSSDGSTQIVGAGYFRGVGVPYPSSQAGPGAVGIVTRTLGMRVGDIVMNVESSAGSNFGRVTLHSVTNSTAEKSAAIPRPSSAYSQGWDCTVSAAATT